MLQVLTEDMEVREKEVVWFVLRMIGFSIMTVV